jgi:hypothetical protein
VKVRWKKVRWQTKAASLFIFIAAVSALSFFIGMKYERSTDSGREPVAAETTITPSVDAPVPHPDTTQTTSALPISRSFLSAHQTYAFTIYKIPNEDACRFTVMNKKGTTEDIAALLGVTILPCKSGDDGLTSGFNKWIDDQSFILSVNSKVLQVDVLDKTVKSLQKTAQ